MRGPTTQARLGDALAQKFRQLPPGMPNVVVLGVDGMRSTLPEPGDVAKGLRLRAEAHDARLFDRHGFADASAFFRAFLRMSAVSLLSPWNEGATTTGDFAERTSEITLWLNPQAKHPLPPAARSMLRSF